MAPVARAFAVLALAAAAFASAQAFRENVKVGLVAVRLDVRGADGKPLRDLKPSEVHLSVDGKSCKVEGLDLVSSAPAAASAAPATSAPPSPTADAPAAPPNVELYLDVLFDETATNSLDRRDIFRELASFLKDKTSPAVHVMLQKFDGHVRTECPWTTDPAAAVKALEKMQKHMSDSRMPSPSELADEVSSGRKARDIEMQVDLHGRRSIDAMTQALIRFPEVPGRKGLVVVTDGTPLLTPYELAMSLHDSEASQRADSLNSLQSHGDMDAARQLAKELQQESLTAFEQATGSVGTWASRLARVTNKALALDIAFYPVDAEAPDRGTNPGVSSKWPGRSMPGVSVGSMPGTGDMTARVGVTQSMNALADMTGGQAILTPRLVSGRLSTIADERASGYILTFRDPKPGDGRYHTLGIAVDRPGARLTYRRGYRVRGEDERTLDAVLAHLDEPASVNPFDLKLSFDLVGKENGRDVVAMRLEYSPAEAPGEAAASRDIQVWAVCADDEGNRATPIVVRRAAGRVPDAKNLSYGDTLQLKLPPGPYTWSVALRDAASGVTSYAVLHRKL